MKETTFQNKGTFSETVWQGILTHISPNCLTEMDIIDVSPGYAKVSLKTDATNQNLYGYTHGGTVFTLCDLTSGMAVYAYGIENVTLQGTINYVKPGLSDVIYAEAKTAHKGKTTAVTRVEVTNDTGDLLAVGTFTMYILKELG